MAPTDDKSTTVMPKVLVLVAAVFLGARLIDLGIGLSRQSSEKPVRQVIHWQDMPCLREASADAKQEFVPPPPQDVSPESLKEIEKLLVQSSAQNKYVLYEFYAPWSDPCKKMESTSLSNAQINRLVEQRFMPVRVTDRLKEAGKNPRLVTDLQKKFRIFAFPTLVIVDENGEPAATLVGNCSSLTTYRFMSRALHSLDQKSKAALMPKQALKRPNRKLAS